MKFMLTRVLTSSALRLSAHQPYITRGSFQGDASRPTVADRPAQLAALFTQDFDFKVDVDISTRRFHFYLARKAGWYCDFGIS